ncbi:hypothetical protein [Arthrobacter sp. StoSoilB22]|uniref:hypothetical protein n=1 Tax=Arthrobacter sp. StoSoilB22 TaxID=2830996 RepID=UPI001CC67B80|nr:hypothetical protein [Arthrobacter sp. StoSoilB22]
MENQANSAAQETDDQPDRKVTGPVPPEWLGPVLALAAFASMVIGSIIQGGILLGVIGSPLLLAFLIYVFLRRWARRTKGYIGLGIVLLLIVSAISSQGRGTVDPMYSLLAHILGPLLAVAAAWCFRQRAPLTPAAVARSGPSSAGAPGGLHSSIDAMQNITAVLVELFPTLPPTWSSAWLEFREIGSHRECVFNVETAGARFTTEVPAHLADQMSEARNIMRGPGGNTWFAATITLNPADPGSYQTDFNYDKEPEWLTEPTKAACLSETRRIRKLGTLPGWAHQRMGSVK